jgi:hypothetical protein
MVWSRLCSPEFQCSVFVRSVIFEPASCICAAITGSESNGRPPTRFRQTRVKLSQLYQFSSSTPVGVTFKRLMPVVLRALSVKLRVIRRGPFVCHPRVMTETVVTCCIDGLVKGPSHPFSVFRRNILVPCHHLRLQKKAHMNTVAGVFLHECLHLSCDATSIPSVPSLSILFEQRHRGQGAIEIGLPESKRCSYLLSKPP